VSGTPITPNEVTVRLGISSCLLGEEVRFDGGHKKEHFLLNTLGPHVEWLPVCPEVEMGMGIPREAIRLVGEPDSPRLVAPKSGIDHTKAMKTWTGRRLSQLAREDLDGYVLKKDSPSCGLFRVRVYHENGQISRTGAGMYGGELAARFPLLPVEEEGRLRDARLRENFIERVAFHTRHKLTVMAHSQQAQRDLGRLVASAGSSAFAATLDAYGKGFMAALKAIATPRRHANVLQHAIGFLKGKLDHDDRDELLQLIESYRNGLVPLIVPITLLRHHIRRSDVPDWLYSQEYLDPYPAELMVRNHV
jgi:uncharacterized protein YbgA (DUF1722 family)/uncharacterized protein YbbK (DUF523 family)